ncbi:MAG TPA: hypothetical protein VGM50_22955 [Gemmatimonadaceae bacterium]
MDSTPEWGWVPVAELEAQAGIRGAFTPNPSATAPCQRGIAPRGD